MPFVEDALAPNWLAWLQAFRLERYLMKLTQLQAARAGEITPEMNFVAERESLSPELVLAEITAGRMVIPANKVHLTGKLQPLGIGIAARCKINANIGNSAVTSDVEGELESYTLRSIMGLIP